MKAYRNNKRMSMSKLLVPLSIVLFIIGLKYKTTDGFMLPTFGAELVNTHMSAIYKFKFTFIEHPIDRLLHFLVNSKSVIVLHTAHRKCYHKVKQCHNERCNCFYKDQTFFWNFPVNYSSINSTFGVVTKIGIGKKDEVIKFTISGFFENSVFRVNATAFDVLDDDSKDDSITKTVPADANNRGEFWIAILGIILMVLGGLVGMLSCICLTIRIIRNIMKRISSCRDRHSIKKGKKHAASERCHTNESKQDYEFSNKDPYTKKGEQYSDSKVSSDDNSDNYFDFTVLDYAHNAGLKTS